MSKIFLKYILALLLFGSNGIVASQISLASDLIVLLRTLIGSIFLFAIFVLTKRTFTFWRYKRSAVFLAGSGIAMGASWIFLYEAYQQVGVSIASLAYYCGPVIVMILAPILFQERLTWPKVTGFMVVLCGVFLVSAQAVQGGQLGWGLFCGGMSALLYALMVICNKKANAIVGLENAMLQLFGSFCIVAVFVGLRQGFMIQLVPGDWLPILILGLLNTGIGCYLYFSSIGRLPVQTVAICGYLEPLSAVLFSVLLLQENLIPIQVLGAVMILGGAMFGNVSVNKPNEY